MNVIKSSLYGFFQHCELAHSLKRLITLHLNILNICDMQKQMIKLPIDTIQVDGIIYGTI